MDQHSLTYPGDANAAMTEVALSPLRLLGWSVAILVGAVLATAVAAGLAVGALTGVEGREGASDFMTQLRFDAAMRTRVGGAGLSVFYVGVICTTGFAAWCLARERWLEVLAMTPIKRGRGRTLILAIATLVYAAAITFAIEAGQDHRLLDDGPTDVVLLGIFLANLCVLAPIAEDLFFRGWLYTALRAQLPFWPSYLVTTILFAAIHWYASITHMLKVLPLAAVLGLVREWKGSVKPTIALHALYNLTIVAITLAAAR